MENHGESCKMTPSIHSFPQAHSTDVVLCSLCPPRRWFDAGVGIAVLRRDLLTSG